MTNPTPQDLLNTSWTIYRLSPLHHEKEFQTLVGNADALKTCSRRLRDLLSGEYHYIQQQGGHVVGGLDDGVGGNEALSRAGALKECSWEMIPTWSHYYYHQELPAIVGDEVSTQQQQDFTGSAENSLGILVTLEYENVIYKAAFLTTPDGYSQPDNRKGSTYLPVLLMRLPSPLRQSFLSFLTTTFDTYSSVLRLPSSFLCARLEAYIASLTRDSTNDDGEGDASKETGSAATTNPLTEITSRTILEEVMKDAQLTLAFSPPVAPALKTINIHLPRESLVCFAVNESAPDTPRPSQPADFLGSQPQKQASVPFLNSLSAYFERHLAMKLHLSSSPTSNNRNTSGSDVSGPVRLSKVGCSAFVLGMEGRIKIIANPGRTAASTVDNDSTTVENDDYETRKNKLILEANEGMLRALILRATGGNAEIGQE